MSKYFPKPYKTSEGKIKVKATNADFGIDHLNQQQKLIQSVEKQKQIKNVYTN